MSTRSWIPYAALLVIFWGVWGAFSSLPTTEYGYPDEMIYIIWSLTMLVPAFFILWGEKTFDRRPIADGMVLAIVGSTLMVYGDEKRGEATGEETERATGEEREQASNPAL